jgi:MFS family permease
MANFIKIYLIAMLITSAEGGINTTFPPFLKETGLTVRGIGIVVSLFAVLSLASRLPSGLIYRGSRARVIMLAGLASLGGSAVGYAFFPNLPALVGLTVMHGFAFGVLTTVALALCIELKPAGQDHGTMMGWYTAAIAAGYAIGNTTGGFVADHYGYSATFVTVGLFALLAALMVRTLPSSNGRWEAHNLDTSEEEASLKDRANLREIWLNVQPEVWTAALIVFCLNCLFGTTNAFFPLYGLGVGLSLTTIGLLRSVRSFCASVVRPLSGLVFKVVSFRQVSHGGLIIGAAAVFALTSTRWVPVFAVLFAFMGLSRGLTRSATATMVAENREEGEDQGLGLASGIYNAGLDLGSIAGPVVGGVLASAMGIGSMFRVVPVVVLMVYGLGLWLGGRARKAS